MGTMEDLKKSKNTELSEPKKVDKKAPWLTYDMKEDNLQRSKTRKLLQLLSILKQLGYPVKTCYSLITLEQMKIGPTIDIDDNKKHDIGIIELMKVDENIRKEVVDFITQRGIVLHDVQNTTYPEGIETVRFFVSYNSIKEVI